MLSSALQVPVYNGKYAPPKLWMPGQTPPQHLLKQNFAESLTKDYRYLSCEVWLYPYVTEEGPLIRFGSPRSDASMSTVERELNVQYKRSGVFIDLDDTEAHDKTSEITRSDERFYEELEEALVPFHSFDGFFYYRTLRGARAGLIFEDLQEMEIGLQITKNFFAQLHTSLAHLSRVEVDAASLQPSRGFAAPHILKGGETPTDPRLQVSVSRLSNEMCAQIAALDLYDDYLRRIGKANAESERAPKRSASARNLGSTESDSGKPKKARKKRVIVPHDFTPQGGDEAYQHYRAALRFLAESFTQHEEMLQDLAVVVDSYICEGRRAESGQLQRHTREILDYILERDGHAESVPLPPAPVELPQYPELAPLRRVFSYPLDDLKIAQSLLEAMGDSPHPIWHGDGLRRYNARQGIWKFYSKLELERIFTLLEGAQVENDKGEFKDIAINHGRITNAVKMVASLTHAPTESSPFDTAPAGVALGPHFVSAGGDGLRIQPHDPSHYAVHALEYELSPSLLQYWQDEDTGRPPIAPPIFCDEFLSRSLAREPEEDETAGDISKEIDAKITTIAEWLGLALLGLCTREASALIAHGPGSNGKSVLASLITDLFGPERTSHLAPQAMKERFSRAQLFGAAVNVVSEMPESDLLESDTIKAMISGDAIIVENKNEKPFRMIPRAAHFFAANTLPASRDRSHGLWRRLIPIEFHHIFSEQDRDPHLGDRLRSEYHILIPWCLEHASLYIQRGGYAHSAYIDRWRGQWRQETDALSAFIAARCEHVDRSQGEPVDSLWSAFRGYAEDVGQSGAARMSLVQFGRSLAAQPRVQKYRKRKIGEPNATAHATLKLKFPKTKDF